MCARHRESLRWIIMIRNQCLMPHDNPNLMLRASCCFISVRFLHRDFSALNSRHLMRKIIIFKASLSQDQKQLFVRFLKMLENLWPHNLSSTRTNKTEITAKQQTGLATNCCFIISSLIPPSTQRLPRQSSPPKKKSLNISPISFYSFVMQKHCKSQMEKLFNFLLIGTQFFSDTICASPRDDDGDIGDVKKKGTLEGILIFSVFIFHSIFSSHIILNLLIKWFLRMNI